MNPRLYQIQMRSLQTALEHLRTLDLAGLAQHAETDGTEQERQTIAAVQAALPTLPRTSH